RDQRQIVAPHLPPAAFQHVEPAFWRHCQWAGGVSSPFIGHARQNGRPPGLVPENHSHSMVPGGFDVKSYTTRLMPCTSLTIRVATRARKCGSKGKMSAVMPSVEVTARSAQTNS